MSSCPQPRPTLLVYDGVRPFQAIPAISMVHNLAPRFGNHANITKVVLGSREESREYIWGVVSGAIAMGSLFFVWCILLLYFKCRGPERYGWLSGSRRKNTLLLDGSTEYDEKNNGNHVHNVLMDEEFDPQDNDLFLQELSDESTKKNNGQNHNGLSTDEDGDGEVQKISETLDKVLQDPPASSLPPTTQVDYETWTAQIQKLKIQNQRMRWCVIGSAIAIVICSIAMVSKGVPGLNTIVDNGRDSLTQGRGLADEAIEVADDGEILLNDTAKELAIFATEFNEACPNLGNQLCIDVRNMSTCITDGIIDREYIYFRILQTVYREYNGALRSIRGIRRDLESVDRRMRRVYNTLGQFDWLFHLSSFFAILLICICLALIGTLCLKLPSEGAFWIQAKRWSRRLFFPTFFFSVLFAFSFGITFVISSIGMADVCLESPDDRVKRVLIREQQQMNVLSAEIAQYFIDGCQKTPRSTLQTFLTEGSNLLGAFATEMENATQVELVEQVCGPVDQAMWVERAESISQSMCRASDMLANLRGLFECSTWFALYESLVYDTLCDNVDALSLIAFTQFFVVLFAFVVVTCRVVIYQTTETEPRSFGKPADSKTSKEPRQNESSPVSGSDISNTENRRESETQSSP